MTTFSETQRFRQPWIWLLMAVLVAPTFGTFGFGLYQQLVLHHPFGDNHTSDGVLVGVSLAIFAVVGGVVWLVLAATLRVETRTEGLWIQFFPLTKRRIISYSEIRSCESRTYSPIGEYGGWGVRYGMKGRAYNVSGNRGVQLALANGENLLLGSQRADELAAAIREHMG